MRTDHGIGTAGVTTRHRQVEPYPLAARPLPASGTAAPLVDLRGDTERGVGAHVDGGWPGIVEYLRRHAASPDGDVMDDGRDGEIGRRAVVAETIKPFDRDRGAGADVLQRVLDTLDEGLPVGFYGWWPDEVMAATTDILGVDAMDVPPPDRKGVGLVDGHAVVIVGYGRHAAFPGGGYLIVRSGWAAGGWGDDGDGYMPFTYVRAYAIELCTYRRAGRARPVPDGDGPSSGDRPAVRDSRLPGVAPHDAGEVARLHHVARCADGRASFTHLFFSEDRYELARARAICSLCVERTTCLARALQRGEPYGIWGGELLVDGAIVADKRARGRPPKVPRPRLVVDEVTGVPISA